MHNHHPKKTGFSRAALLLVRPRLLNFAVRRGVRWGRSFIASHADSVISREVDKDTCTLFQLFAVHNMASFTHPHFDRESGIPRFH